LACVAPRLGSPVLVHAVTGVVGPSRQPRAEGAHGRGGRAAGVL